MDVDVAVAGSGVDHRHRRDLLQRRLQPFAAARDQEVDQVVLVASSARSSRPPPASSTTASGGRPGLGQRLADDRRQRAVGPLGVVGAAEDDRVAALDGQRGAIDRHVRARLVDDGDDAERHPQLAQPQPSGHRFRFELLADRVGKRRDRAHALGHRLDPGLGQVQPVAQRRCQPCCALVGEVGGIRLEHLACPLAEQPRGRLEGGILGLGRARSPAPARPGARLRSSCNGDRRRRHRIRELRSGAFRSAALPAQPERRAVPDAAFASIGARTDRDGSPRRPHAGGARAPRRFSARSPGPARATSSRRSPCRPPRRRRATSTASPASKSPSTAVIPTGSRLDPLSRRTRAAPSSTITLPRAGFAYLSQSLKLDALPRPERRSGCRPPPRAAAAVSEPDRVPSQITLGIPASLAISAAATLLRIPPEPKAEVRSPISAMPSSSEKSPTSGSGWRPGRRRGSALWRPSTLESSTSSRASSRIATCAARKSLSPKLISSVAVVSFSLTTGTTPQAISRRRVRRAFR